MSNISNRYLPAQRVGVNSRTHCPGDTRSQIVRAAGELFHKQGVDSTTTDEIVEGAGITKGEFRRHFGCKLEVVGAVLRRYFEVTAADVGPVKYALDTWYDLQECLSRHIEVQKKFKMTRGCRIGTVGSELKEGDELTRQSLSLILDLVLCRFASFFSQEKVAGRLASDVDVEQLATLSVVVIQGAMLMGKIRRNPGSVERVFEDLLSHLKCYAKAPAALRKRVGADHDLPQLSTLPKASEATTVVKLHDSLNPGDSAEERPVDQ